MTFNDIIIKASKHYLYLKGIFLIKFYFKIGKVYKIKNVPCRYEGKNEFLRGSRYFDYGYYQYNELPKKITLSNYLIGLLYTLGKIEEEIE